LDEVVGLNPKEFQIALEETGTDSGSPASSMKPATVWTSTGMVR
jgi:hypothetical protein